MSRLWTPRRRLLTPATRVAQAPSRRGFLQGLGAGFAGLAAAPLLRPRVARADEGVARRVIFMFMPDGVPASTFDQQASEWHAAGSEHDFTLSVCLEALEEWRDRCVFLNGVSMPGDLMNSHNGGYEKLLTAASDGLGISIDQVLATEVGSADPWSHLYLGAQATGPGVPSYNHLVYPMAGSPIPPEDDPRVAYEQLLAASVVD